MNVFALRSRGWAGVFALLTPLGCSEDTPAQADETGGIELAESGSTTSGAATSGTTGDDSSGADPDPVDGDVCGDGERGATEACDDGNVDAGDGCSDQCETEPLHRCPVPGLPCVPIVCGDGKVETPETCDDGNDVSGDGCDSDCAVQDGFACLFPGAACQAAECGDGIVAGFEACDDANAEPGDGCSSTCTLEDGHHCPTAGQPCALTECGDGLAQGTEHCDDGNIIPFDGCSPTCTNEPSCSGGVCQAVCGDGIILPGTSEACDDGNTVDGDGCSSACQVENGFQCVLQDVPLPETLELPVIYRDFRGWNHDNEPRHPDFNNRSGSGITFGIVDVDLDADGLPVPAPGGPLGGGSITTPEQFLEWYRDTPGINKPVTDTLQLGTTPDGYQLTTSEFFPINGLGWTEDPNAPDAELRYDRSEGVYSLTVGDNFNFTSEVRYWFQFEGDERLEFLGDDDVWVFVDGRLCLDIGGIHGAESATMDLGDPASENNATQRSIVQNCVDQLDVGNVYEVAVFHAERRVVASNFQLTLSGFVTQESECSWVCGDGVVTPFEVCDDGTENNTGGFGMCNEDCLGIGPYCGDGIVDPNNEACDLGPLNVGSYEGCNADCTPGPYCGDGVRDPQFEECDAGEDNGGPGSSCRADCTVQPAG